MKFRAFRSIVPALALAASFGLDARAGIVVTTMDTSTPVLTLNVPSAGLNEAGYIGPNTISVDGGAAYNAYCTDLFRSIGVHDSYAVTAQPVSSLANGGLVANILAVDAASGDTSSLERAATQLAIWDAVESGRAGLGAALNPLAFSAAQIDAGADHFYLYADASKTSLVLGLSGSSLAIYAADGSGVVNRMAELLTSAQNRAGATPAVSYLAAGPYGQGFIALAPSVQAVPEPSTLVLSGIGLAGMAWRRLGRKAVA